VASFGGGQRKERRMGEEEGVAGLYRPDGEGKKEGEQAGWVTFHMRATAFHAWPATGEGKRRGRKETRGRRKERETRALTGGPPAQ